MKRNFEKLLKEKREYIITGIVFAFFIFTMLFKLLNSALWGDEWVEYYYSQAKISNGELYRNIIRTFQPPLYNFVMHFWLKIGQSILWFRLLNVFLGIVSGIVLYKAISKICNKTTARISVFSLACCYQWVFCIQECSEYALMLCFIFISLYLYIECFEKFSYIKMLGFILSCVAAIYSQYGSVFVVIPLLLLFYCGSFISKNFEREHRIVITSAYLLSLSYFALPLYTFFLSKQMSHNQIGSYTVPFTAKTFGDIFVTFGRVILYFFNLNAIMPKSWEIIGGIITICLMIICILLIIKYKLNWISTSLIICMWVGYVAHYYLVQKHIYAMVHPNQSAGFYARYSYFYIPILVYVIPIIIYQWWINKNNTVNKKIVYILGALGGICLLLSLNSLLDNWNKAKDDQYAQIWMDNKGWENPTYLFGVARFGFEYYVRHSEGFQEGYLDNATNSPDINNLPPQFWLWRTNWAGDGWQEFVDKANELGYDVIIYDDSGYVGQLAFCSYNDRK